MTTTTATPETLEDWLKCHRISNIPVILDALNDLGATELRDLLDLEKDDVSKFEPPLMKKLEYLRFSRGIESLQESAAASERSVAKDPHVLHQVPEIEISVAEQGQLLTYWDNDDYDNDQDEGSFPRPPLPSQCPTEGCAGVLSLHLGSRKSKYLMKIHGTPDSRWTATCSICSKKWHCCHFLCGKLQKLTSLASSDIIRHEQGRVNRWQRKIQPPCSRNPRFHIVRAGYEEEMKKLQKANNSNNKPPTTDAALVVEFSSGTHGPSSESMPSPIPTDEFDDELKSIFRFIDEETFEMNMDQFDSTTSNEIRDSKYDIDISISPKEMNELPANKKVKTDVDSSAAIKADDDTDMVELCDQLAGCKVYSARECKTDRARECKTDRARGCIVRKFLKKILSH